MDTGTAVLVGALVVVAALLVIVLLRRSARRPDLDTESLRALLADVLDAPETARHRRSADQADTAEPVVSDGDAAPGSVLVAPAASAVAVSRSVESDDAPQVVAESPAAAETVAELPGSAAMIAAAAAEAQAERLRQRALAEAEQARSAAARERARVEETARAVAEERQAVTEDRERVRLDRADIARQRRDLAEREQALQERMAATDARQVALDRARAELDAAQAEADRVQAELARQLADQESAKVAELERVAALTKEQAHAELLAGEEESVRRDVALMIRRVETEAQTTAKGRARQIVADAIARVASDQTSQSVVSVLHLPSDELKGRIIGREGRNIRAFETVTGVNVIIDDTPEAVLLSCFDPVRREIGRVTLQALIDDGRIHPHRIEEAYERAHEEVEALCQRAAEDALLEVGITDMHPELVSLIGQLKYRTSYGQNVLGHLVETSHIARIMAAELGVDANIVARGAFLHDIGKALTHEAQGSHAIVGAEIARKHGESAEVVHCIEAHHDEVPPATVEAVLTQAADACSGGRPGARRESLESYVQRLQHIEAIASAKKGVEKVFAMQAGRELRVMVKPEVVDDLEAHLIAREVAKQIEEELTYPGQVRVTVIRESRATEVAR